MEIFCNAQNIINFKMCDVYYGKVKTIKVIQPEQMAAVAEFSEEGLITSYETGGYKYIYEWIDKEEAKCSLTSGDVTLQSAFIYINNYTDEYYDFDAGAINMKLWFNKYGKLDHGLISQNNQCMKCTYNYKNADDDFPYKIEQELGMQKQTLFVQIIKRDSHNNVIEFTQTSNGQTIKCVREIIYY